MHMPKVFLTALAIGSLMIAPAYAGQKSKGPTAPHGSPQTTSPKATGPKTTTSTASTQSNPHTTTATTTTKAHGNPHAATSGGNTTTATTGTSATTGTGTSAGTGTGTGSTTATTPLNPIAQKLQGKPLGARIEKMLPSTMTLNTASAGFRNQGQFIAAVHVSQNLGIPFADLRATMLGLPLPSAHTPTIGTAAPGTTTATSTTTSSPLSLGQAIQKLRPSANSTTEAARAQTQATADLSTVSSTSAPPPTTTTSTTSSAKKKR
jgi:hypothetical protein